MSEMEVGVRDLRNHTRQVIQAVDEGKRVVLTRHGRPIAEIRPLARSARVADILNAIDSTPRYDSGLASFVEEQRQADLAAERTWQ